MSRKIDERVVELKFNSKQFADGVKDTTQNLAELERSLQMDGVASAVDNISSKFSVFGAIAFTALQTLTNAAIGFGQKIASSILDPLIEGGRKRAMNIEQAKFQFKGLGMDVEQSMADALYAVKDTAFGLDEAAVAASQFGASGIKSGAEMQSALRGISGVAAMAGSSYTDMANVFTKVAGQGRLMGDDLNRLGTRGINAASTLADYFNKTGKAVNATEADIRAMVTKGEIDFQTFAAAMSDTFGEHATKANETYTGSLSNMRAAIARIGAAYFTPQLERSRKIFNALTPAIDAVAKAITPLLDGFNKLADAAGDRVVKFIEGLNFTDLTTALTLFTRGLSNVAAFVGKVFAPIGKAFEDVFGGVRLRSLSSFAAQFARFTSALDVSSKAGERIRTVFTGVFTVLKFVLDIVVSVGKVLWTAFSLAFQVVSSFLGIFAPLIDIFTKFNKSSKNTGEDVTSLADKLTNFMNAVVKPLIGFFDRLRAAVDNVVKTKIGKWASDLGEDFKPLEWIGEKIVAIFSGIKAFFTGVWNVIKPVVDHIGGAIKNILTGFGQLGSELDFGIIFGAANTGILFWFANAIKNIFSGGFDEITKITGIFGKVSDIFEGVTGVLESMQTKLKAEALMKIAIAIGILAAAMFLLGSINPENIGSAVVGMATLIGVLAGVMLALEKLVAAKGFSSVKLAAVAIALNLVALAVLGMAIALKLLSTIGWDELARGLIGLGVGLGIMVGAVLLLGQVKGQALAGAAALAIMSTALLVLSISIKLLASMSWQQLATGLVGLAVGLGIMVGAILLLGFAKAQALAGAAAIAIVATALLALTGAVAILGSMNMATLAQGLIALTAALAIIIGAVLLLGLAGPLALLGAASMLIMAAALIVITLAIMGLAALPGEAIGQAIGTIAAALGILLGFGIAMGLLAPLLIAAGVSIILLASGLLVLAVALTLLSLLPADGIATALGAIAAALGILIGLGVALGLLSPILIAGGIALALISVSLLVMAAAMAIFAISLGVFAANAPAAAEGLSVLADAMYKVVPLIPLIALVGIGLIAFGAGALVAGVGISVLAISLALMAGALALLAMTAPMGVVAMMLLLAAMVPMVSEGLKLAALGAAFLVLGAGLVILGAGAILAGAGLIVFATGLRMMIPVADRGVEALKKVVEAIAGMIWQLPQLALMAAGFAALGAALVVLGAGAILAGTGAILLGTGLTLLNVAATMGAMAMQRVALAVAMLAPSVPMMGMISAAIAMLSTSFAVAASGGQAAARGITSMVTATNQGTTAVMSFSGAISGQIPGAMTTIGKLGPASSKSASEVIKAFVQLQNGIKSSVPGAKSAVNTLVTAVSSNLVSRMNAQSGRIYSSGQSTGRQMSSGMAAGINSGRSAVINAAINVASAALQAANNRLDIRSPSRETEKTGKQFDQGFAGGIIKNSTVVTSASESLADSALTTLSSAMSGVADFIFDEMDTNPTIKPVLDLTAVKKDALLMSDLMKSDPLPVRSNYQVASNISRQHNERLESGRPNLEEVDNSTNVTFNQSITSPKALSTSEIYRNTKNQISTAKEKLKV